MTLGAGVELCVGSDEVHTRGATKEHGDSCLEQLPRNDEGREGFTGEGVMGSTASGLRSDGLYVNREENGWGIVRFVEGGACVASIFFAEPLKKVLVWLQPKAPTRANQVGCIPAPVTVDADRMRWTSQRAWDQDRYDGVWATDHIVVRRVSSNTGVTSTKRFEFISNDDIVSKNTKALAAMCPAPPDKHTTPIASEPPSDAHSAEGGAFVWVQIANGQGTQRATSEDIVRYMIAEQKAGAGPTYSVQNSGVPNLRPGIADALKEAVIGDEFRCWLEGGARFFDVMLSLIFDKKTELRTDGLYVGPPTEDGTCAVVRLLDMGLLSPLRLGVAHVARDKLELVLEWHNIATVKGLFMMPAPFEVAGDHIRWTSQVSMEQQIAFDGTWGPDHLLLSQVTSNGWELGRFRFEFVSREAAMTAAKKPNRKARA